MRTISAILGGVLILFVLWEGFETVVLPRRVIRRIRLTRFFYRCTWLPFAAIVRRVLPSKHQESYLGFFGPLSLPLLLGVWACGMVTGFGLLYWANAASFKALQGTPGFLTVLYLSGTTFFTLGLGDITPITPLTRALTVIETGLGFGFLALVLSYLPALNQSFARREVPITLLDARAGSPPTAVEMLRRHQTEEGKEALRQLLYEWEHWSAELLESHLSYPVLAYFRSQHDNQSWLAALTAILDTCALIIVGLEGACKRQAQLTFAMARHAAVDIAIVFRRHPATPDPSRLSEDASARMLAALTEAGLQFPHVPDWELRLGELRQMYEPYAYALSRYLQMRMPPWIPEIERPDYWQTSPWDKGTARQNQLFQDEHINKHF